jgi:hypothetical protein
VFQGDISPASLLLELPVIAHFRNSLPVLQIKQFILGLFSTAEKSIIYFLRNSLPVRQCCWKLINIFLTEILAITTTPAALLIKVFVY